MVRFTVESSQGKGVGDWKATEAFYNYRLSSRCMPVFQHPQPQQQWQPKEGIQKLTTEKVQGVVQVKVVAKAKVMVKVAVKEVAKAREMAKEKEMVMIAVKEVAKAREMGKEMVKVAVKEVAKVREMVAGRVGQVKCLWLDISRLSTVVYTHTN